jgi:hypothetical protein
MELQKPNPQIINIPMKKWAHELNRKFLKKQVQMGRKFMKKCSTFLAIKKIQIKTILHSYEIEQRKLSQLL